MLRPIALAAIVIAAPSLAGCIASEPVNAADAPRGAGDSPAAFEAFAANGRVVEIDLWVIEGFTWQNRAGNTVGGFAFSTTPDASGASVPGPTIRLTQGDTLRARLHYSSNHVQPHTIHWHGITLPWEMDGVPFVTQHAPTGEDFTYTYEWVAKETGTYWYHCHVEAPTHIDLGMFGALIIDPADPSADPPFDREATLMLHEMDSDYFALGSGVPDPRARHPYDTIGGAAHGSRTYVDGTGLELARRTGLATWSAGPREYYPAESLRYKPLYNTFMINGKSYPDTEAVFVSTGETLRVRLINAGVQPHTMHLHGHHFLVTHKDGYRLPVPYYADTLLLGSGERYDVYVHATNPGIWDFHDHGGGHGQGGFASNEHAFPGGMNTMLVYEDFQHGDLPLHKPARSGEYAAFAKAAKQWPRAHRHG